ncbi:ABC transporter permease [Aquimarina gracilis]|uniref:ABC transporter permease n=1 Tax=Aquimarina gracilis TaxID=874422 RepID=A0ABU5ZZH0_9FLAO|nr:ABC transporter permease [Aquimarina gracilis]MEB3347210.1 ABC transporter permease [Aquimarina gracilis]
MFKNYIKIAWRNLIKNKVYSFINIGGLAIGMACFLIITMFIRHELSYDLYHDNANNIYRAVHHFKNKNSEVSQIWGSAPIGEALRSNFSEVQETVQFSGRCDILLTHENISFQESNCFYVDASVLDVFSWPLISGNPKTALEAPYSVVLTESTAKKYFGNQDPIGKTIEGGRTGGRANEGVYTVTGVMKDVPSNSHFSFDVLMSMSSFRQSNENIFEFWGYVDFYTYFLVKDGFNLPSFQSKVDQYLKENLPEDEAETYSLSFEPLKKAYLYSDADRQPGITGNLSNIYVFMVIGLFILVIACINFMNLATARSLERAKEVGIRKVIGADKKGLIYQFLGESLVMVFLASIIGLIVVIIALKGMQELTGKDFELRHVFDGFTMIIYFATVLCTGFLAGMYPAFILSGFKPASVLKGIFRTSPKGAVLRKGLVIFQFSLSIALIASTVIVYSQLEYMLNKSLGFNREHMLTVDFNYDAQVLNKLDVIKSAFLSNANVSSVSASRSVPGSYFPGAGTEIEIPEGDMVHQTLSLFEVDVDFIPHFGIDMAAGRPYSRDFPADTASSMVINEAAAKLYGYKNPNQIIGKRFSQWGKEGRVVGVVKDFNYLSLHQNVEPMALRFEPLSSRYLTLKIQSENLPNTIAEIENQWKSMVPHRPFLYNFLNDSFNKQYVADIRFKKLFTLFSSLAILIACLGLLGLATYSAVQRTKEIGVRKVLGAEVSSIVKLLSIDFIKLVVVAIVVATPFSWYAMQKWLEGYAYQIPINWWVFCLSGFMAVVIALLTVSFQAFRAASVNPVKSLRAE